MRRQIRTIFFIFLGISALLSYAQNPQGSTAPNPSNNSYMPKKKEGGKEGGNEGVRGGFKEEVKIDCSCFRNYSCSFAAAWLCTHPEDNKQSLPTVFPQPNSLPNQK